MKIRSFFLRIRNFICVSVFFFIIILTNTLLAKDISLVHKVLDGDTIVLDNGEHIRLLGIDAPEMGFMKSRSNYISDPQPMALRAKNVLKDLIEGKMCSFEYDVERVDTYGRKLAYCFTADGSNVFLNKYLLTKGMAVVSFYPPNLKYVELFLKSENEARNKGIGLWSLDALYAENADHFIGQLRSVQGTVLSVFCAKKYIYLNFAQDYKSDFTIGIKKSSWYLFKNQGIVSEKWYTGKKIVVSGRIRDRYGAYIEVSLPEQIKILN